MIVRNSFMPAAIAASGRYPTCHLRQSLPIFACGKQSHGTAENECSVNARKHRMRDRAACPVRCARPFQRRRRLVDGQPSGDHRADGAVSVPDLRHHAGQLSRRAGVRRNRRASGLRHLAGADRRADRARGRQRADRPAQRPADLRRAACRLLRLERHRGAAHVAQPRLSRRRDALLHLSGASRASPSCSSPRSASSPSACCWSSRR